MNTSSCQLTPASPVLDLPVQPQLTDQPCLLTADLFTSPIPDLPQGRPCVDMRFCVEGLP